MSMIEDAMTDSTLIFFRGFLSDDEDDADVYFNTIQYNDEAKKTVFHM
jgi:hypothetical protein